MHHDEADASPSVIKVVDRRRFSADGAARHNPAAQDRAKPTVSAAASQAANKARERSQPGAAGQKKGPDFMQFIATLATNAMAALGALPQARERGMPVDPQMAREYIDIICMLQERTAGNLSPEEDTSLRRLLAELQRGYGEATGQPGATAVADPLAGATRSPL